MSRQHEHQQEGGHACVGARASTQPRASAGQGRGLGLACVGEVDRLAPAPGGVRRLVYRGADRAEGARAHQQWCCSSPSSCGRRRGEPAVTPAVGATSLGWARSGMGLVGDGRADQHAGLARRRLGAAPGPAPVRDRRWHLDLPRRSRRGSCSRSCTRCWGWAWAGWWPRTTPRSRWSWCSSTTCLVGSSASPGCRSQMATPESGSCQMTSPASCSKVMWARSGCGPWPGTRGPPAASSAARPGSTGQSHMPEGRAPLWWSASWPSWGGGRDQPTAGRRSASASHCCRWCARPPVRPRLQLVWPDLL